MKTVQSSCSTSPQTALDVAEALQLSEELTGSGLSTPGGRRGGGGAAHRVSVDYGRRKHVYRPLGCAAFTCTCEAMVSPSYTPCQSPLQRAPQRRTQNESSVAEMDGRRCLSLSCSHSAAAIVRRSLHQYYVDVPPRSSEVCEPAARS